MEKNKKEKTVFLEQGAAEGKNKANLTVAARAPRSSFPQRTVGEVHQTRVKSGPKLEHGGAASECHREPPGRWR